MELNGFFQGLQTLTLDDKGRIAIPSRYRSVLTETSMRSLVITIDLTGLCLWLYPATQWEIIIKKLQTLPSLDSHVIRLQRLLIGHAFEVELDNQGRFLIPPALRSCVGLSKSVMFMGQGNRFELWDANQLEIQRKKWLDNVTESSSLASQIQEIVF